VNGQGCNPDVHVRSPSAIAWAHRGCGAVIAPVLCIRVIRIREKLLLASNFEIANRSLAFRRRDPIYERLTPFCIDGRVHLGATKMTLY
jgi:hypothetical protein